MSIFAKEPSDAHSSCSKKATSPNNVQEAQGSGSLSHTCHSPSAAENSHLIHSAAERVYMLHTNTHAHNEDPVCKEPNP